MTSPLTRGPLVKETQALLSAKGFATSLDGIYGPATAGAVRRAKWALGYPEKAVNGDAGDVLRAYLGDLKKLPLAYRVRAAQRVVKYCYPHPAGYLSSICQGLHPTEGIPGNWAVDLCAHGGTPIVAPFAGRISRLSGHDPATGTHGSAGDIFGWSTYLTRADGMFAYLTHQGKRSVAEGQSVSLGQQIGIVGNWPGNPGRSHTHIGITSPKGWRESQKLVLAIAHAPRLVAV